MAGRIRAFLHDKLIAKILHINDTPHAIALGVAIGMFLAMTPTVGIQVILAIAVSTLIGANRIAAVVLVFVSNPLTMLPIYWIDYRLGCLLTGAERMTHAAFDATWQRILDAGMIGGIQEGVNVLLGEIGLPMMVGGSILGLLLGVPLYPVTYRAVLAHRKRREARLAYERLRELRSEAKVDPLRAPYPAPGERPARPDLVVDGGVPPSSSEPPGMKREELRR